MNNRIDSYTVKNIPYREPEEIFDSLEHRYMASLLTGKGPDDITKSSIIGIKPYNRIVLEDTTRFWESFSELHLSTDYHSYPYPINQLGAIGFISYEALHTIEDVPKQTKDNYNFPLMEWMIYSEYYYFDREKRECFFITINYMNQKQLEQKGKYYRDTGFSVTNLKPDFSPEEYMDNVQSIQSAIIKGDVYEVNLTQSVQGDFSGSPYSLFKKLYRENSAPYTAYLERDEYTIVSNSPELFLKANNNHVETRPIKGTAPRSTDPSVDKILQDELYDSPKNQAELYMIVDLMRNDLSRVCDVGSVEVITPKRIEHYTNVHHLVSIIQGRLKEDLTYIDLFKACFPGGSITGCPKVSCMTLTEKLEKSSRNLYTGTIFLMNRELLNSSIVIRSAIIQDGTITFNSGGAITIDSDPEEEYEETLIKLASINKVLKND